MHAEAVHDSSQLDQSGSCWLLCAAGSCVLCKCLRNAICKQTPDWLLHAQIKIHDFDEGALNGLEERSPADAMRILEVFRTSNPQEKDNKCEAKKLCPCTGHCNTGAVTC